MQPARLASCGISGFELLLIAPAQCDWTLHEPIADELPGVVEQACFNENRGLLDEFVQRCRQRADFVGVSGVFVEEDRERFGVTQIHPLIDSHALDRGDDCRLKLMPECSEFLDGLRNQARLRLRMSSGGHQIHDNRVGPRAVSVAQDAEEDSFVSFDESKRQVWRKKHVFGFCLELSQVAWRQVACTCLRHCWMGISSARVPPCTSSNNKTLERLRASADEAD